jgi:branched-subunit amino acid transport protein
LCGVLAWRTKQLWVGLFVGMVAFWGLRAVLP